MVGVSIIEKETTNGTTSDFDGNYTITIRDESSQLLFSYIGFTPVTKTVGSGSTLDIVMEESAEALDEVIVTSLGFKEQKDELGYASSTVSGNKVAESGETNVLNSLSGKSSGVRITRNSSDPGAGSYIQIRGVSSITRNSQPLIIVDGVPISNDVRGNSDSGGVNQESRLNDINPNDIESITVLKGASAAALWGTQALGGVINITTKSGKFNSRLSVSLKVLTLMMRSTESILFRISLARVIMEFMTKGRVILGEISSPKDLEVWMNWILQGSFISTKMEMYITQF